MLPPFVSVSSNTGQRLRTLVLRADHGTITYEVLRGADPLLGATDLAQPPAAQRTLDAVVSTLTAPGGGDAQDQGQALAAMGIGYVLLPAPADTTLASTLNDVAGLRAVSKTSAFQLWRVAQTAARVRVLEPGGQLVSVPSGPVSVSAAAAPRSGGTLELARAGRRLDRHPQRQGAAVRPLAGGQLGPGLPAPGRRRHPRASPTASWAGPSSWCWKLLALLVVAGLGLPGARVPGESAAGGRGGTDRGRPPASAAARSPRSWPSPGWNPGWTQRACPREDEEPARGSRLSRRAAAAGRTGAGRAGAGRTGGMRAGTGPRGR